MKVTIVPTFSTVTGEELYICAGGCTSEMASAWKGVRVSVFCGSLTHFYRNYSIFFPVCCSKNS